MLNKNNVDPYANIYIFNHFIIVAATYLLVDTGALPIYGRGMTLWCFLIQNLLLWER
jgi:hypothetical protein